VTQASRVPDGRVPALLAAVGVHSRIASESACGDSDKVFGASADELTAALHAGGSEDVVGIRVERCGGRPGESEDHLLALDGGKVVGRLDAACIHELRALPAVDGVQRVLGLCTGMGQGYTERHAHVYGLSGGVLSELQDLGRVDFDNCGAVADGVFAGSTLHVAADGTLTGSTWTRGCDGNGPEKPLHEGFPADQDVQAP
jgi:hypothetical protein